MAKEKKKGSGLPLIIIGVVLIVAVVGFAMLYNTSKPSTGTNTNRAATNTNRPTTNPANAPPGAALGINVLGSPTATVTVEEFADFQCPSCAVAHPVLKDLQSTYAGNKNVRFIFRHFPLPIHDKAYDAAAVVEAAGMQGATKFWAMMDQLMTNQQTWANSNQGYRELWKQYAQRIGLDVAKWETDASSIAAKGRIDLDIARARGLGVGSTPSVYINGKLVPFSDMNVPTMKQLIEAEIESTAKATAPAANTALGGNGNSNQ